MNMIQDVIPRGEKTIRQIPIKSGRTLEKIQRPSDKIPDYKDNNDFNDSGPKKVWLKFSILLVSIFVIVGFIAFSTVWARGKLSITPKQQEVILDTEMKAYKNAEAPELPFDIMVLEKTGQREIEASEEKQVATRASGTVVVYNNYNSSPQRLIKNTRFETEEGLVYRIQESITVPGQRQEGGKTVAGSIEVKIYADTTGEKYNIGLSDFTIPGFKGDPRYDKFYARSKTSMTGGFEGLKKVVEESKLVGTRNEIIEELRVALYKESAGAVPEGFVLYNDAIFIQPSEETEESKDSSIVLSEKVKLYGIIFSKKELSKEIASKTIAGLSEDDDVIVHNIADLDFTIKDKLNISPEFLDEISFNIVGNPIIVWQFDEELLKKEIAGKSQKDARGVLTKYPSIERAELSISPFWKRSFPKDIDKIRIIKNIRESVN